jgi:hypothetical protein
MIKLIVAAVILIVIMLVFVFILFRNIIKRMDSNAKKYFVNKMQDYDYILEEKQNKLNQIESEIKEIEKEHKNVFNTNDNIEFGFKSTEEKPKEKENDYTNDFRKHNGEIKYNLNVPDYRETQFFNNYKEVKKIFSVNNEKIIEDFIAEHKNPKEEKEYKELSKLRNKFDSDTIYELLTLSEEDQSMILNQSLTDAEKELIGFDDMNKNSSLSIKELIKSLDERLELIEPTIYIYTNNADSKYDLINENIVIRQYRNISEGIIIKYRNKIYDYSI